MKMQWESLGNIETWLWIIIWWLLAWLMFFLCLWLIEGKLHAKRKLGATALVAIIAVIIVPLLQGVEGLSVLLAGLGPYIAFFIVILLMKGLAADEWSNAVIVSFIGILFLLIINNALVLAGVTPAWPLFVAA